MENSPRLLPRAFFLTPANRTLPPKVKSPHSYSLAGYTLHAEELTEIDIAENAATWVVVIGTVWPLSTGVIPSDTTSIAASILELVTTDCGWTERVDEALYDLGGRYAILVASDGEVTAYNDASGNRSVFFSSETREISSHFSLIRRGLSDPTLSPVVGNDSREELSWERTRSPWINTLVPNHRATLSTGVQTRFFPLTPNRAKTLTSEERLDLIEDLWEEQLARIIEAPAPKAMSITAGKDTRMLLAMAMSHIEDFTTFTYTSDEAVGGTKATTVWSRSGVIDLKGAKLLEPFLPQSHQTIAIPADHTRDPGSEWVSQHTGTLNHNSPHSHNRRLLPHYLRLFPDPRTIYYRGNLLEIGRSYLRAPDGDRDEAFIIAISQLAKKANLHIDQTCQDAVSSLERLQYYAMPAEYDLSDMFYWEQRHGRWFAQVLNETDVAFNTVTPFNVRRIIDMFLAYSIEDRAAGFAQNELTYRAAPLLTFHGINGAPDLYRQFVSSGISRST